MNGEEIQRRLAAILAADVVGYSRLMEVDEGGTLARLKELRRAIVEPAIARHRGRLVKLMGDGLLVEFASVVDAVRCAVAIQEAMAAHQEAEPEHRRIDLRVGINLGDLIVEGEDLYGDGINVAARLEKLASPGGICLSRAAADQVRNKTGVRLESRGEHTVKNIARPIEVFRVVPLDRPAHAAESRDALPRASATVAEKPSIAVLAFTNMSGDAEQEYFSDGISEDIITDLSKLSDLHVIARNSSFVYKNRAVSVPEVARELGVRYVLEGSVRRANSRVRVTAQLVDSATGGHLWADRFDRELTDIFAVQDELTREIVSALALQLKPGEQRRLSDRGTANFEAYDLFLRGRELIWLHTRIEGRAGQDLMRRVIALDPGFGRAYALLAFARAHEFVNRWVPDPPASLRDARALAEQAVEQAPDDPECHWALGVVLMWQKEHDRALDEGRTCIALEPSSALGHVHTALVLTYAGHAEEAIETFNTAFGLDPHYPDLYLHFLALAHFHLDRFDEAAALLRERLRRNPHADTTRVLLASTLGQLGRHEEARTEWEEARRINPEYSFAHRRKVLPYKNPADLERLADGLRMAGLPA